MQVPLPPQERIAELTEETKVTTSKYRRMGDLNEQFTSGAQWGAVSMNGGPYPTLVQEDWSVGLPRIWSNRVAGLLQSWAALLTGGQPTAITRPASPDALDAYRSEIANAILQYVRQKQDTVTKISETVRFAGQHGTAGIKVTYDADDEEVRWDVLTIYGYIRDPTPDYRDAQWLILESWINQSDAKQRLKQAGIDMEPSLESHKNSLGEDMKGVRLLELYEKPNENYPEGRYASVVAGETVQEIPFPYFFDVRGKREYILPVFLMKVRNQRDSPYGATPITDLIPLQRSLNETIATHLLRQRMGAPSLVLPKGLAETYNPMTSTVIGYDLASFAGMKPSDSIFWTQPPPQNQDIDKSLALFTNEMMAVIGLNDTSAGNAQRAQSGAAIDSLLALDQQKNADATSSMKAMLVDAFKFTLMVVATLYPDEKKMEIAAASQVAVDLFDESDVGGVDLHMQIDSEVNDTKLGAQRTPRAGMARERAKQVVADFVAGADVLNDPAELVDVDAESFRVAIDEAKAAALAAGDSETWKALHMLQDHVDKLAPPAPVGEQQPNPDAVVDTQDGEPMGA